MAQLTDDQKLAVIEYVKSVEEKKEERLFSVIKSWSAIIGVSAIAVLTGFASFLESRAIDAAQKEVDDIRQAGKIDDAILDAYRAISSARAKGDALEADALLNLERSKALLLQLQNNLEIAQGLNKQFTNAADVQAAVSSLNNAKNDFSKAIASDPTILKAVIGTSLVPKGAIAAFGEDITACPLGWNLYAPARGRFIIGAGVGDSKDMNGVDLTDHVVSATGGEERHKLSLEEMPSHRHQSELGTLAGDGVYGDGPGIPNSIHGVRRAYALSTYTSTEGGGTPFNTMPPFVALSYCIKE